MKHNRPSAKTPGKLVAFFVVVTAVAASGCGTLPHHHSSAAQASPDLRGSKNDLRINLNTATSQELEKLPGIGEVIAERIVAHRAQYGPFRRAEHLMMVRGISDRKFREIRSLIVVQ